MHLVLRGEAFSMFLPLSRLAVKLSHIGLEQDFSSTPPEADSFASTFPSVATDLSLVSGSGHVFFPTLGSFVSYERKIQKYI